MDEQERGEVARHVRRANLHIGIALIAVAVAGTSFLLYRGHKPEALVCALVFGLVGIKRVVMGLRGR